MEEFIERLKSFHFMSYLSYVISVLVIFDVDPNISVLWALFKGGLLTFWIHLMGYIFGGLFLVVLSGIHDGFGHFFSKKIEWMVPLFGLMMALTFIYR